MAIQRFRGPLDAIETDVAAKLGNTVSATDKVLGRVSVGAGAVEEIAFTAAARALADDADAAAQRTTLGLGTLATQSGTFSGTSSGTNTGDQTITLTGAVTGSGTGSFATTLAADPRLLTGADMDSSGQLMSRLPPGGTFLMISGTAYATYLGRVAVTFTPQFARFYLTTVAVGVQVCEIGFFSSPTAPAGAGQTLTKIEATGTLPDLTVVGGTGIKGNTSAFVTSVPAGTFLWAVFRSAFTTVPTQPTCSALGRDNSRGYVLVTAGAGALTGLTTLTGALIAPTTAQICPEIWCSPV